MKQMKRITHILLALTAIIAVSCSKHDTERPEQTHPEQLDSYIFFEAGVTDVVETKVDLLTGESLPAEDGTAFGVVGFYEDGEYIFDGYDDKIAKVYRNDGAFQYDILAPWMGTVHTFHAFYPYSDLNSNVKVGTDNIPYIDYTQPSTPDAMIDILGAYKQVTNNASFTPVQLHFQHLLWAFNLTIKNIQTIDYSNDGNQINAPTLTIRKVVVSFNEFPTRASLKLDNMFTVTSSSTGVRNFVMHSNESGEPILSNESQTYGPLLFIPVTGLKYQVTIEYTTSNGIKDKMIYPAEGEYKSLTSSFERGKLYNLTINKTNDKFFIAEELKPKNWASINVEHTFQ